MVCHTVKINAIIAISVTYEFVTYAEQRAAAIRASHGRQSWQTILADTLGKLGLFAGLDQRAVAARALQQLEKAEHASGKEHDVERQRTEHQVGPERVLDQERAHDLENVSRRQRPRYWLQPCRQCRDRVV